MILGAAALAALVLVAAVGAWLLTREGDEDAEPRRAPAELASVENLRERAAAVDGPVFWAGPRPGMQYELSQTGDGRIYIRYLPPDVAIGDPRANFLTIGTYPVEDALAEARRSGGVEGAVTRALEGGGLAVYNERTPTSVYIAFRGVDRLVEVYDPSPETARRLAYSGAITPVVEDAEAEPEQPGRPVAATEEDLEELAADVDHPVYWLGPRRGFTYELTRLPNGQIYIRYLPDGVDVGDDRPEYETVGTYPVADGLATIEEASAAPDAVTFGVAGGGRGYYSEATPTNVHFALPDSKFQVEVFHPTPGRARQLVRTGRVVPIR